ncbi:hypothetical protein AB0G49_14110 [Streptomyces longwoodensis]|uniref:hypothetical protein n=1 Tax=Streptomyces longwoodensis TaxID=68231 RepID=UPI0033C9B3DC
MLLGDSGRADSLDRCLSGEAQPTDEDMKAMLMAASALTPKRPVSQAARARALAAMFREADRVTRTSGPAVAAEDTNDPGMHVRVASAGPGKRLRVADIEEVDDARLEEIAAKIAARLSQKAPDRKQ